jgi:hypothetical protein
MPERDVEALLEDRLTPRSRSRRPRCRTSPVVGTMPPAVLLMPLALAVVDAQACPRPAARPSSPGVDEAHRVAVDRALGDEVPQVGGRVRLALGGRGGAVMWPSQRAAAVDFTSPRARRATCAPLCPTGRSSGSPSRQHRGLIADWPIRAMVAPAAGQEAQEKRARVRMKPVSISEPPARKVRVFCYALTALNRGSSLR